MRKLTIVLLCITIIWSYYKTAINGQGCHLCNSNKKLFCNGASKTSLDEVLSGFNSSLEGIERLVAYDNEIKLTKEDIEALNKLTSLRFLDLRNNKIKNLNILGKKSELLEEIDFDGNVIDKIKMDFFSRYPNLNILKLGNNKIDSIPDDLLKGNKKLKAFDVSGNPITEIPSGLFEVDINGTLDLESLLVDNTFLEDIDTDMLMKKLPKLKGINVRGNKKMVPPFGSHLDPRLFYEHGSLQFLFTSGYADCCTIKRMKNGFVEKKGKVKKEDWYCAFREGDGWTESCAIRISSGKATDTFMGNVEVNFDKAEKWQRLTSKSWTMREAEVVCREIGYEKALEYINETNYVRRMDKDINSTIFRKSDENKLRQWNGNCTGKEYSILRCNGGENVNELKEDPSFGVGVRCKIPEEEMEKVCPKSEVRKIVCPTANANFTIHNLPWQNKNDTDVKEIEISGHRIRWLDEPSLTYFKNLQVLDLSDNGLGWLGNDVFNIDKLETLILHNNNLKYITNKVQKSEELKKNVNWFGGLRNLKSLDMSTNYLVYFPSNVFEPLKNLQNFSMKDNRFRGFQNRFFRHLTSLRFLDISEMPALRIENWDEHLTYLKDLNHLIASRFTDCCFVQAANPGSLCNAPADLLADCDRIIKYPALRFLVWFLVVLAIGGNMFALLMRLVKDDSNKVQNMLICSLSFSDMLMGIYLAGIINQDIATRGEYFRHDINWRTGISCKVFGVISVISSEVSVFTLVIIAYDRFLHIVHALEFRKIGYRAAVFLLAVTWLGCSAIAIIPAVVDSYFYNEVWREGFYGTNSICLPLQLPGENSTAWEYCLAVFGALNFVGAVYLIVAYCQMFYSSYTSAKNSKNNARLRVHTTVAKRFAAVVFTDVCCWVPIAMLLLLSLTRAVTDTSHELYMWFSICVIPINSAINPILYTLSTPLFWEKVKETIKKMLFCISKGGATTVDDKPELIKNVNREKKA